VNSKGTGRLSIKKLYKNPSKRPVATPKKGFQKYHVVKNSFTLLGRGVILQLLSILTYLDICMQRYALFS